MITRNNVPPAVNDCPDMEQIRVDNARLAEAIEFATKKHAGQLRKGTTIPYILHPMEVLQILYSARADTNLMIAGVLHDVVEDTDATSDEVERLFGEDVASLVAFGSEDKSKSWEERKGHTIKSIEKADHRRRLLELADKLSNIRAMAYDYSTIGDKLWERFAAPKSMQAWYYGGVQDALYDMQFEPGCSSLYWEFVARYKDVFVKFYVDKQNDIIYQICDTGEAYQLSKLHPVWEGADTDLAQKIAHEVGETKQFYKTDEACSCVTAISRAEAELTEDMWQKTFWDCVDSDTGDAQYPLFCSERRIVDVHISGGEFRLQCSDWGEGCYSINGSDEYEFAFLLGREETHRLFQLLRAKYGTDISCEDMLKKEFAGDQAPETFRKFCKRARIRTTFYSR